MNLPARLKLRGTVRLSRCYTLRIIECQLAYVRTLKYRTALTLLPEDRELSRTTVAMCGHFPGLRWSSDRTTKLLLGVYSGARWADHRIKQVLKHLGWVLAPTGVHRRCLDGGASGCDQPVEAFPL
jgi:hypothetical protein